MKLQLPLVVAALLVPHRHLRDARRAPGGGAPRRAGAGGAAGAAGRRLRPRLRRARPLTPAASLGRIVGMPRLVLRDPPTRPALRSMSSGRSRRPHGGLCRRGAGVVRACLPPSTAAARRWQRARRRRAASRPAAAAASRCRSDARSNCGNRPGRRTDTARADPAPSG